MVYDKEVMLKKKEILASVRDRRSGPNLTMGFMIWGSEPATTHVISKYVEILEC